MTRDSDARPCPPTLRVASPYGRSGGDLACDMMALTGDAPDGTQRAVMRDWLAVDADGRFVHARNLLECARQNLKSFLLRTRALYGSVVTGESILYTAHNYDTAAEMRDIMFGLFGNRPNDPKALYPWLNARVSRVSHTNGHEAIYLRNGGRVYFSTRTKSSKRGFTVDVVIVDEAQELREEQSRALLATASAAPLHNPQYIFAGTPPTPGCYGDSFQAMRDDVAQGSDASGVSLNEWSASDIAGFVPDLEHVSAEALWYATNPALGTRIEESSVRAELKSYRDPLSFAQERLGYWLPPRTANSAIGAAEWDACRTRRPPRSDDEVVAYAAKFSPDGSTCAIAACTRAPGCKPHVEMALVGPMARGVDEYAKWMADRFDVCDRAVVDGRSDAAAMVEKMSELGAKGARVVTPGPADVCDACAGLLNAVRSRAVTHFGQDALTRSATQCEKRKIGKSGGWGFDDSGDAQACVVEAAALALWAASKVKRHRKRDGKVRIGC